MSEIFDRLGECEVCGANAAKYTCPKCEVKTCQLKCVNIHKKELECDGIRDKTKYKPLSKFTNLDLLSDYRLLEEVNRSVETVKKDKSKQFTRIHKDLPHHLYLLKKALRKRRTIIQFMPGNFSRHKENKTFLHFQTGIVYWQIEWCFPQADNLKLVDSKCEETLKLSSIVHKYLDASQYTCNEKFKYYQSLGVGGLNFYLRAEYKPGDVYFQLDSDLALKECFANKTIIEFPTIYVIFKDHAHVFETINSDDEEMVEATEDLNPSNYINAIVKAEEKQNKQKKKNGSLLFVTEYSEDELSDDEK